MRQLEHEKQVIAARRDMRLALAERPLFDTESLVGKRVDGVCRAGGGNCR